jgi:hypothetical protein
MVLEGVRDVTGALLEIKEMSNVMCNIGKMFIDWSQTGLNVAKLAIAGHVGLRNY